MLLMGFFHAVKDDKWGMIHLDIGYLIEGGFGAGCVMITFGALLGKVSPLQLLLVAFFELILYALNFFICYMNLKAVDIGGSMFIHSFGAYFGLACAKVLTPPGLVANMKHEKNASRTTSDMTAMIGTIFLWILWPSFNGAFAPAGSQFRVVINTALALNASCISAFIFSRLFSEEGVFDMVHIQNSTLAGGVAVGSSADLLIGPGGALTVGFVAGLISVLGYIKLTPWLEDKFGLDDTCGVHNLHGLPGLLGGTSGIISCAAANTVVYGTSYETIFGKGRTPTNQPGYQAAALAISLGISLAGGALTGFVVKGLTSCVPGVQWGGEGKAGYYDDSRYWEVPEDFERCGKKQ
jgi:ammonium transporter Rh